MRDILIEFRDNMVSRGTISQNDILSLESMIGENIITNQKAINYFTKDSTQVGTQEVKTILDNKIESINIVNYIDIETFLQTTQTVINAQKYLKDFILDYIGGLPQNVIDFFNDPKYAKFYINSDNGQELVEAINEPLYGLIISNSSFFIKFKEVIGIDEEKFQQFENYIQSQNIISSDCDYYPLLSHLLNTTIEPLTFNLLVKVKDNMETIINHITESMNKWFSFNTYENIQNAIGTDRQFNKVLLQDLNDAQNLYKTYDDKVFKFVKGFLELFK
jgi:hypothetical protein